MGRREGRGKRGRLKIACFWAEARSLDRISFRHEHLLDGFAALGHSPELVTAHAWIGSFDRPRRLVSSLTELEDPAFWRRSGFDLAVGLTWLHETPVLAALAAAGVPRVALADSDGQLGYAVHPRAAWSHIGPRQESLRDRLRASVYFARRYLASARRRDPEELDVVASARASTAIAFASREAIARFRRFLVHYRAAGLSERAFAAPYPVPRDFGAAEIPAKEERLVAIGRWSDPQKDAPLLASALERLLTRRPGTRVTLFGAEGAHAFGALAARFPAVELPGERPPSEVRPALAASRALVLSSRWETGPHVAFEALALGTTLVGPPLPNLIGLVEGDRFGTVARDRRPRALAAALVHELELWERGGRDGRAIAARWRPELSAEAVCRRLLDVVAG